MCPAKAPPDERGGNRYVQPTATASHSHSTNPVGSNAQAVCPYDPRSRRTCRGTSPDSHPVLRCKKKLVAWLDVEGVVPGVHVAHHAVDAVLHGRVGVRNKLLADRVVR